jgi:hypothetical protein
MTTPFLRLAGDVNGHPEVIPIGGVAFGRLLRAHGAVEPLWHMDPIPCGHAGGVAPGPARSAGGHGAEEGRPWERPGAVRRDCETHRGTWLLALADADLLVGALSLALGFLAPLGLDLGVTAWALASHDLGRMRAGLMDPAGWEAAARARTRAGAGVALSLYGAALWGWFLALMTRGGC